MLSSSLGHAGSVGMAVEVTVRGCSLAFAPVLKVCASPRVLCSPPAGSVPWRPTRRTLLLGRWVGVGGVVLGETLGQLGWPQRGRCCERHVPS
jgi:hypothetical protein